MGQTESVWEGTWDNGEPDKVTNGLDISYTYNKSGQVEDITYKTSYTALTHTIDYVYDGFGRINEIQLDPEENDDNTVRQYFYDTTTGELTHTRDYRDFATETTLVDYIQTDFDYNSAGLMTLLTYSDADLIDTNNTSGITEQYEVEYDGRGYIIGEQLDLDYSTTEAMTTLYKAYEYDSIGRLMKAARGDTEESVWSNWDFLTEYTYDRVGNRMSMDDGTDVYSYSYTQFNQLEEITKNSNVYETYEYDLRGNQLEKYTGYSSGNPTVAVVFDYDLQNRLNEVGTTTDVTGLTNVTTINENSYNSSGQRISKSEDDSTENYFYSGGALIYTKGSTGLMLTENILDLNGNIIASTRFDDEDESTSQTGWEGQYFFYHYDIRGSVTAIVDPEGHSVKEYAYDEFSNLSESGEATFDNEVTFTGSITDTSTGLQYMNARFYEPTTGRFISQDSYSGNAYDPWTQHLYSYCGNNPVNMIDPTGHMAVNIQSELVPEGNQYYNEADKYDDYGRVAQSIAELYYLMHRQMYNMLGYDGAFKTMADEEQGKANGYFFRAGKIREKANSIKENYYAIEASESTVEKVLSENANEASKLIHQFPIGSLWFKNKVDHEAVWDYKREKPRSEDPILNPISELDVIYYKDEYMTWEEFGNFHYGYVGTAGGFPQQLLILGSIYAQGIDPNQMDVVNLFEQRSNEAYDHIWIKKGINSYLDD